MKLESMEAEIRPRNPWEAVDLGMALTRKDYGLIVRTWILSIWPIYGLTLFLCRDQLWLGVMLLVLFQPLFERVPLFILSRALFGERPTLGKVLRSLPAWLWRRWWFTPMIAFSWRSTFLAPIVLLEGLKRKEFSRRVEGLSRYNQGKAWLLQFLFYVVWHLVWPQLVLLFYLLVPLMSWLDFTTMWGDEDFLPPHFLWACIVAWLLVGSFLVPFLVGGGFGLYLNARTRMEGWDIELTFRQLSSRLVSSTAGLLIVGWSLLGLIGQGYGQTEGSKVDASALMEEVLSEDAFIIHEKTGSRWRLTSEREGRRMPSRPEGASGPRPRMGGSFDLSGLAWVLLGVVVIYALYWLVRMILDRNQSAAEPIPKAETVMGMMVTEESLPQDLVAEARALSQKGDLRGCLALLYRGSLSWMIHTAAVPIRESDTEMDCLRRANRAREESDSVNRYLASLTKAWIAVAYGKETPPQSEVEALLAEWPYRGGRTR